MDIFIIIVAAYMGGLDLFGFVPPFVVALKNRNYKAVLVGCSALSVSWVGFVGMFMLLDYSLKIQIVCGLLAMLWVCGQFFAIWYVFFHNVADFLPFQKRRDKLKNASDRLRNLMAKKEMPSAEELEKELSDCERAFDELT